MADVQMSTYVCRWCGAPYSVPTAMADNSVVIKRCPSGHRWADGQTMNDQLRESERICAEYRRQLQMTNRANATLRGHITKLKKAR